MLAAIVIDITCVISSQGHITIDKYPPRSFYSDSDVDLIK